MPDLTMLQKLHKAVNNLRERVGEDAFVIVMNPEDYEETFRRFCIGRREDGREFAFLAPSVQGYLVETDKRCNRGGYLVLRLEFWQSGACDDPAFWEE